MAIVSINFGKVNAEKKNNAVGKIGVNNNVSITDLEKASVNVAKESVALKLNFKFVSKYDPDIASITIEGELVMVENQSTADEFLKKWGTDKQLPKDTMINVYNAVMHKCFVVAIMLTKELNLPAPIRFPRVTNKEE